MFCVVFFPFILWELRKNNYPFTLECPQDEGSIQVVQAKGEWS